MKKLIVFSLFISSVAFADQVLEQCKISCSPTCQTYANQIIQSANEVLDNCGDQKTDIIQACKDRFIGNDELTCAKHAKSVEVVHTCVDSFIGDDELECAVNAHNKAAIKVCVDSFIGDDELTCAKHATSAKVVKSCVDNFIGTDELKCVTGEL